jgi:hypothetical protein
MMQMNGCSGPTGAALAKAAAMESRHTRARARFLVATMTDSFIGTYRQSISRPVVAEDAHVPRLQSGAG